MKACHNCGREWTSEAALQPGVKETCEGCSAYLHCCLNCRYYDTTKACDCYIPNIDPVSDKEKFNFCDDFSLRDSDEAAPKAADRGDFDALFGETPPEETGPADFDDLFKE